MEDFGRLSARSDGTIAAGLVARSGKAARIPDANATTRKPI